MKRLFFEAAQLPVEERSSWLDANCPASLRSAVEELLVAHDAGETDSDTEDLLGPVGELIRLLDLPQVGGAPDVMAFESLGEFRLIRRIAAGGMAVVYLAEDTSLDREVAVKVLPTSSALSEVEIARFRQEAKTVAQLQHPSIVPVYRVGYDHGVHYLAMEYIEGQTLARLIHATKESDARKSSWVGAQARIAERVADALAHAHEHGVIHRDVKPSNILLDTSGQPRLADFGIAKNTRVERTSTRGQPGTKAYMSPEQAMSQPTIDHRSDVFSLGVTLYEALTLEPPFTGISDATMLQNIIHKQPRRPRSINPAISRDLETVILKALEKDPVHRYQTASHMSADLRCVLDGRPILARRASVWRRSRVWVRDHRMGVAAAAVLLLALLAGGLAWSLRSVHAAQRVPVDLVTDPSGARVELHWVDGEEPPDRRRWVFRATPVRDVRLPAGLYRAVFTKKGRYNEASFLVPRPAELESTTDSAPTQVLEVSVTLAQDTRGMVKVDGGVFDSLGDDTNELREVGSFWIDAHEVTNSEYAAFVKETDHEIPFLWKYDGIDLEVYGDHPVVGITHADACAYAHFYGKRLPDRYEWEYAMRQPLPPPSAPPELSEAEKSARMRVVWEMFHAEYIRHVRPVDEGPETALGIRNPLSNVSEFTASISAHLDNAGVSCGVDRTFPPDFQQQWVPVVFPWETRFWNRGFRCVRPIPPSFETSDEAVTSIDTASERR